MQITQKRILLADSICNTETTHFTTQAAFLENSERKGMNHQKFTMTYFD